MSNGERPSRGEGTEGLRPPAAPGRTRVRAKHGRAPRCRAGTLPPATGRPALWPEKRRVLWWRGKNSAHTPKSESEGKFIIKGVTLHRRGGGVGGRKATERDPVCSGSSVYVSALVPVSYSFNSSPLIWTHSEEGGKTRPERLRRCSVKGQLASQPLILRCPTVSATGNDSCFLFPSLSQVWRPGC